MSLPWADPPLSLQLEIPPKMNKNKKCRITIDLKKFRVARFVESLSATSGAPRVGYPIDAGCLVKITLEYNPASQQ